MWGPSSLPPGGETALAPSLFGHSLPKVVPFLILFPLCSGNTDANWQARYLGKDPTNG